VCVRSLCVCVRACVRVCGVRGVCGVRVCMWACVRGVRVCVPHWRLMAGRSLSINEFMPPGATAISHGLASVPQLQTLE
jgi:hypothetical protein